MNESKGKRNPGVKRKAKEQAKQEEAKHTVAAKKAKSPKADTKKAAKKNVPEKKAKKPEVKKSKKEESKDVKAPKRSWPAFFFFQNEKRLVLKKENPEMSQKELVSKLGEMWRSLSEAQKKPYIDQERKDKARYMKEKEEFKATNKNIPAPTKKDKKGKAKAATKGPKRAWPPFFFFQEQRREDLKKENPNLNHKEIVSKLGEEWRGFTEEEKQPFVDKSIQDQKRYDKEKREFQDSLPADAKEASTPKAKNKSSKSIERKKSKEIKEETKAPKGKKVTKPKSKPAKPDAPKRPPKRPLPPVRPSGSRHSKRIKKNEEEKFLDEVKEFQAAGGTPDPELEKVLKEKVEDQEEEGEGEGSNQKEPEEVPKTKPKAKKETKAPKPKVEKAHKEDMDVDKEKSEEPVKEEKKAEEHPDVEMVEEGDKPKEEHKPKSVTKTPTKAATKTPTKHATENKDVEMAPETKEEGHNEKPEVAEEANQTEAVDPKPAEEEKEKSVTPQKPETEAGKPVLVEQDHPKLDTSHNPSAEVSKQAENVTEAKTEEHKDHNPNIDSEEKKGETPKKATPAKGVTTPAKNVKTPAKGLTTPAKGTTTPAKSNLATPQPTASPNPKKTPQKQAVNESPAKPSEENKEVTLSNVNDAKESVNAEQPHTNLHDKVPPVPSNSLPAAQINPNIASPPVGSPVKPHPIEGDVSSAQKETNGNVANSIENPTQNVPDNQ